MIFKYLKSVFFGDKKSDGGIRVRVCDASAGNALAALFGGWPAQVSPDGDLGEHGMALYIVQAEITSPAVAGTAFVTVPKGAIPVYGSMICKTAGTAGGTTTTASLGIAGTVDKYGTFGLPSAQADSVARNAKGAKLVTPAAALASAEDVKLFAAAIGGGSAGDTALTGMVVLCELAYWLPVAPKNYA